MLTCFNGRNTGKEIYNGENKVAAEYITYRKVGDHATNMPATVWFGNGEKIADSIKYKYDSCGNICQITQNGHIVAKYTYDSLNRIIREDNKAIGKTVLFTYDNAGNITERCEYAYTSKSGEELAEQQCTHYSYDYDGDRLKSYNGEKIEFKNETLKKYRGNVIEWQYGSRLTKYGSIEFAYDGLGRRISKKIGNDTVSFTYDNDGRLIKQSDKFEFVYDASGVVGIKYASKQYFYRKDVLGNIIAILDSDGEVVVNYVYDAWGNHAVLCLNEVGGIKTLQDINDDEAPEFASNCVVFKELGELNPFRYRGYYYDTETGLYYLQTRYYDPEVGRFISQDSIEYADPETINGLNLYAYCGNNPVMNVDPSGNAWWHWVLGILIVGAAVALSVVTAGLATPISAALGGGMLGGIVGGAISGAIGGAITGFALSVAVQGISNGFNNIDWRSVGFSTLTGAITGAILGGIGGAVKVANAAKVWSAGKSGSNYTNMMEHFVKHGKEMGFKTAVQYTNSAKEVIKNGVYLSGKNAFATLAQSGKYHFVGVIRGGMEITTYSFRTFTKATAALLGLII